MSDEYFLLLIEKCSIRNFMNAHQMLDDVTTDTLIGAVNSLLARADILFMHKTRANYCEQFANQIRAVLHNRGVDVSHLFVEVS